MTTTKENSVTMTATEDPAQADAIPLGSYRALRAWREHREAALAVPLSPEAEGSVNLCQAGMMLHAMEQKAQYLLPAPVAEPLPKRVPQPYTPGLLVTEQVPVAEPLPKRVPGAASLPPPLPLTPYFVAAAPVTDPIPDDDEAQRRAAEAQHEAASRADLERWTKGKDLADEKAEAAVENLLDIHDTDPAGETVTETAVLPGLDDESPA